MKRKITAFLIMATLVMSLMSTAIAATKDDWYLNYKAGAPSGSSVGSCAVYVDYDDVGYRAKATTLSGSYNRYVTITAVSPASMSSLNITGANALTPSWTVSGQYTGTVHFTAIAHGASTCYSTGWIYQNYSSVYNS